MWVSVSMLARRAPRRIGAVAAPAVRCVSTTRTQAAPPPVTLPTITVDEPLGFIRYKICPFCCGTRAFLDASNIPYRPVEVNPLTKEQLRQHPAIVAAEKDGHEYKTVPVIVWPSAGAGSAAAEALPPLGDSRAIVSALLPQSQLPTSTATDASVDWAYANLLKLFPLNIYRTIGEAWEVFAYLAPRQDFSFMDKLKVRVGGAAVMWAVASRMRRRMGVTDEREALYEASSEWLRRAGIGTGVRRGSGSDSGSASASASASAASGSGSGSDDGAAGSTSPRGSVVTVSSSGAVLDEAGEGALTAAAQPGPFHGGHEPDLADVVVWGALSSMRGMRTLADLRSELPELDEWYTAVEIAVGSSASLGAADSQ